MADEGKELSAIDFSKIIGGPLIAVIKAQAQAANTTVNFINQVGYDKQKKLRVADFSYEKVIPKPTDTDPNAVEIKSVQLSVPFLSMVPVPYIRVSEVNIDFLAKITSMTDFTQDFSIDASVSAEEGMDAWIFSSSFKASVATQYSTHLGVNVTREYSLSVKVKAVQDEIPRGLDKLLSILEGSIKEK